MKFQYAIVVGRFQPYHKAHHELVTHALTLADKVIIVLGSARKSPDVKNPFTPQRRERMVRSCFDAGTQKKLVFKSVRDYPYNENFWTAEIQNVVREELTNGLPEKPVDEFEFKRNLDDIPVVLVGYFKDASSYYLKQFPQWKFEQYFQNTKESRILHGTDIRELFFSEDESWEKFVLPSVCQQMREFHGSDIFKSLKQEFDYVQKYRKDSKFTGLPFSPTFLTTDAVVTTMGHVLVVRRGHQPGKGLIALPGGFLDQNLTIEDNMIKELKEETKIHVSEQVLRGSIKTKETFDYPYRSQRGRTVTTAYHVELEPSLEKGLPLVRGGDDADQAFWMPISSIGEHEEEFFEDHVHIVRHFLGLM
jgi:bifunctional NMN adenylyltransferase/nudix hydrolase